MSYVLLGADGRPYRSSAPGALGGHRRGRRYGRLDCPSALRAIARGHYVRHRVFFADEATAIAAGYRPCGVCLPGAYARWKDNSERAHSAAELATLTGLLTAPDWQAGTVTIGHSRDASSRAAAHAFQAAWTAGGGDILAVVDWPEAAASWLRPASRLTAETPDAWVFAARVPGFAQLARRLRLSTGFDPARAVAFADLQDSRLPLLAGRGALDGLRGASADGGTWAVRGSGVTSYPGMSRAR
ncbi:type 1 periplasmic-binding domain-containing protein [Actinoplanes sp. RD1]|uniref:hypothetical protein n=1 Tax=Actinoplanes sp. RD1 TaxID=3064538 RepID=UPI002740FEC2|nr:hypothetical protein [Actinoplanes sp. RD1]